MVPILKNVPGAWLLDVMMTVPESSVAVGSVHVAVAPVVSVLTTISGGQLRIVGGLESTENGNLYRSVKCVIIFSRLKCRNYVSVE